jgi:hypothetical protein
MFSKQSWVTKKLSGNQGEKWENITNFANLVTPIRLD